MQTYAIARLNEIDPLPDGHYHYRPVRHHLGIQGFGVTAWLRPVTRSSTSMTRTPCRPEELFIVMSGRATFELEGEKVGRDPWHPRLHRSQV